MSKGMWPAVQVQKKHRFLCDRGCWQLLGVLVAVSALSSSPARADLPPTAYSRTEQITYQDDTTHWVLGQVAKTVVDGVTVSETTYTTNAQPATIKSFGKLQQSLTYNADGTVAAATDGVGNVTTFASWKRGIPQSITYVNGNKQSAVVDDNGWITSVTNEAGYRTSYTYDAMGRMAGITYPTGDSTVWSTTTQVFEPVMEAEYGLPAGHWRQTITTGNARKTTYYDAFWRPVLVQEYDIANQAGTQRFQRFAYDAEGRQTFASYPSSASAASTGNWKTYDALGRVTSSSQDSEGGALVTLTEYLTGNRIRTTDPLGHQVITSFQAFDQPSYEAPVSIEVQGGATTMIPRDVFGKPVSISRTKTGS